MNRRIHIAVILTLFSLVSEAQEFKVVRDFELWSGIEIEKTVAKKWDFHLQEEIRYKTNATELNNFFTQVGVNYHISKNFSLEGRYRQIKNNNNTGILKDHSRYSYGLSYKGSWKDFSLKYRFRYQKRTEGANPFRNKTVYEIRIRNKIQINYEKFEKLRPFLSTEIFQTHVIDMFPEYDLIRTQTGLRFKTEKLGNFRVSYSIERELSSIQPFTYYILGLHYAYKF